MRTPLPLSRHHLATDTYSGIAPRAWQALDGANHGHRPIHGEDPWTTAITDQVPVIFEIDSDVSPIFIDSPARLTCSWNTTPLADDIEDWLGAA